MIFNLKVKAPTIHNEVFYFEASVFNENDLILVEKIQVFSEENVEKLKHFYSDAQLSSMRNHHVTEIVSTNRDLRTVFYEFFMKHKYSLNYFNVIHFAVMRKFENDIEIDDPSRDGFLEDFNKYWNDD